MKMILDLGKKEITIEEQVNIGELFDELGKLFPQGEWKNFKLNITVINTWNNPIIIKKEIINPYGYPWYQPIIYGNGTTTEKPLLQDDGIYYLTCINGYL